jgi:hypothetical protein
MKSSLQRNFKFFAAAAQATFALFLCIGQVKSQEFDVRSIVAKHFPQALLDEDTDTGLPLNRNFEFVIYDTLANGAPRTIIACYSDNVGVAIRVMQAVSDGSYSIIFEPSNLPLIGTDCGVALVDVDGDGVKEVKLSVASMQGNSSDWVFKWDGRHLENLTPATADEQGQLETELFNSAFFDFDHDGTLQVLSVREPTPRTDGSLPTEPYAIYHLQNGKYVKERDILFFQTFYRWKGEPQKTPFPGLDKGAFSLLQKSTGPYFLRVVNGDKDGSHRASSGHIVVNGVEVAGPNRFSQQVEFFSVPVNLQTQNTIQVTLEGKPESKIIVTVEDQGAQQ